MNLIFQKLNASKFRREIHLSEEEKNFVRDKCLDKIIEDAYNFLDKNIRSKKDNDGKQTPWRGHPVFVAQHATATCCRKCIKKWYKIPENKNLDDKEVKFFIEIILEWIDKEINN
ncbi:DUF4186 family protein [Candidatus Pacearchaeota archaeon]|nr:DUF4186 family protein [Candidatus Pacearchaeota archaeon]